MFYFNYVICLIIDFRNKKNWNVTIFNEKK